MIFSATELSGAFVVDLEPIEDARGFFARAWDGRDFAAKGLTTEIAQVNTSLSRRKGTLRGMHYQVAPHEEAKLVRCIKGAVFDVVVDLRPDSETYKRWTGAELTASNRRMMYVPQGCAHGFQALGDDTEIFYLVSAFYSSEAESGVRWDDSAFGIDWPLEPTEISDKDRSWPDFAG